MMAVYNREAEFGCIRNGMLEVVKDRIDISEIRILAETPGYPAWAFSYFNGLKPEIVEKLKKALLKMPEDLLKEVEPPGKSIAFAAATDEDFNSIREVADTVGIEY
jgi:phosphonate transport system substrate-binding protein